MYLKKQTYFFLVVHLYGASQPSTLGEVHLSKHKVLHLDNNIYLGLYVYITAGITKSLPAFRAELSSADKLANWLVEVAIEDVSSSEQLSSELLACCRPKFSPITLKKTYFLI